MTDRDELPAPDPDPMLVLIPDRDIDDAEFEKLQQKLFGDKSKGPEKESSGKPAKAKSRGRKAK